MPRECSVCSHPEAFAINEAIVGLGEEGKLSNRAITRRYGLSKDAVRRHKEHIPQLLVKALEAEQAAAADELLRQMRALQGKTLNILIRAESAGDLRTALAGIREARGNVELLAKLRGELDERPIVNIALIEHPDYRRLEDVLTRALEPYPAARYAVAGALKEIEG